jgi:hypothetical protein
MEKFLINIYLSYCVIPAGKQVSSAMDGEFRALNYFVIPNA